MAVQWSQLYAQRTARMQSSVIRDLLHIAARPQVISLAGGLPAPELFPAEEFRAAFDYILSTDGRAALQYGPTEGYEPLKQFLAERLGRFGIRCGPADILITNGSQQALDLIGKVFLNPGDLVAVENPSYVGGIQAFDSYEARYAIVPMDEGGMRTDVLERTLAHNKVKFVYVLPNFQNPSGRTLSLQRRREIIELSNRYGVPIVEDDPYGELRYEGEHLPSIKSMDTEGNVLYLGTFSKILAPGLRLGWVVAPDDAMKHLVLAKQPADLATDSATQRAVWKVCQDGLLEKHVPRIREAYRQRRDAMLAALERYMPEGVTWTHPQGGLFLWVMLPESIDTRELLREAVEDNVAFVPGTAFHADGSGHNTMRLNFSNASPERLEEAIRRLSRAISRELERVPA